MSLRDPRTTTPGTVDDLLADAVALGRPVTGRMVTDWIAHGLLDNPDHRSAGQGHGSHKAVFPSNQRQLFQVLVQQRGAVNRLAVLTSVPLVLWAYWGDEHVPTRQARRALATALETRKQPKERSTLKAAEVVDQLKHPDANPTAVNRLRRLLVTAMTTGRIADPNDLDRTYTKVFDPHHTGRPLVPTGLDLGIRVTPTQVVTAAVRQQYAADQFLAGDVTDAHLETAREHLQQSLRQYAAMNPLYVALSGYQLLDVARQQQFQELTNRITPNLLLVLGALLAEERRGHGRPSRQAP